MTWTPLGEKEETQREGKKEKQKIPYDVWDGFSPFCLGAGRTPTFAWGHVTYFG
jgi:hypothetical protein